MENGAAKRLPVDPSIAAIHTICRTLGMDEDMRRALYLRMTGCKGLTLMDPAQRRRVLDELQRLGGAASRPKLRPLSGRYARKLQALWIAAFNLGLVRERNDRALEAFVRRQTGLERERFLHQASDAARVIEALKGWMAREAGVDWSAHMPEGERIARAQWRLLGGPAQDFAEAVLHGGTPDTLDQRGWIRVMNKLGRRIRQRSGDAAGGCHD